MLTMKITNDGDAHARLKGSAYIKDEAGDIVVESPIATVVLDSSQRDYSLKFQELEQLTKGENYTIEFNLNNSFTPQNKFKSMDVPIAPLAFVAP